MRYRMPTVRSGSAFETGFLARGDFVFARLGFVVFPSKLLLQFLDRQVDGCVEVRLLVFGK